MQHMTLDELEQKSRKFFTAWFSKRAAAKVHDPYCIVYRQADKAQDGRKWYTYFSAGADCCEPQGVGLYGQTPDAPIDRHCHKGFGRRIKFSQLPREIQGVVLEDIGVTLEEELPL